MKASFWRCVAAIFITWEMLSHPVFAQSASTEHSATKAADLRDLRNAMLKAQDRFLYLYNKVNRNADQSLTCTNDAPTGSRLTQKSCSTRAQTRATAEQARNFLGAMDTIRADQAERASAIAAASDTAQARGSLSSDQSAALAGAQNPDSSVTPNSEETTSKVANEAMKFEQNLQLLLNEHPDLQQRYDEFLNARGRYLEAGGRL
jgi:hypothetical protein